MFAQMTSDRLGSMNPMAGSMSTGMPAAVPNLGSLNMVPRCTIKLEKCATGMKINCVCDDEMSCATLQNLCKMLGEGLCSLCCMKNGIVVCQCNLAFCNCTCTMTEDGCCITCTSGDKACCGICQGCCDCCCECLEAGCVCCVCFNGTPVCCGTC